jgi:hypothetical protein
MANQTLYTELQRTEALAALAANGGNVSKTARETGIPRKTIETWRDGVTSEEYEEKKVDLADRLETLCFTFAEAIAAKLRGRKCDIKEMSVAFGITVDKLLLLRGSPTAITRTDSSSATANFDISNLDPKEVLNLYKLQMKACGLTEPQASDLQDPVICNMDEPEDQPPAENPTDEPATTDDATNPAPGAGNPAEVQ